MGQPKQALNSKMMNINGSTNLSRMPIKAAKPVAAPSAAPLLLPSLIKKPTIAPMTIKMMSQENIRLCLVCEWI